MRMLSPSSQMLLALSCFVLSASALGLSLFMPDAQATACDQTGSEALELTLEGVQKEGKLVEDLSPWGARRARVINVVDNTPTSPQRSIACVEVLESDRMAQRRCFEQQVER